MHQIDMSELTTLITAFFGGLALLAGAFFKYMSGREKAASLERKEERAKFEKIVDVLTESKDKQTQALIQNTNAMREMAKATKKSAEEAAERNGHLAELVIENKKSSDAQYTAIVDAIHDMKEQHVGTQHADKQTVVHETVKNKRS